MGGRLAGGCAWPAWKKTCTRTRDSVDSASIRIRLAEYLQEEFRRLDFRTDPVTVVNGSKRISQRYGAQSSAEI